MGAFLSGLFLMTCLLHCDVFDVFAGRYLIYSTGIVLIIVLIILFYKQIISDTFLFFCIILVIGTIFAFSYPTVSLISWDDQTHYERCVILSHFNLDHALLSDADSLLINSAYQRASNTLPVEAVRDFTSKVNELYLSGNKHFEMGEHLNYGTPLTYIPSSIALLLGRAFCLPYSITFSLGRWANTLLYSVLCFFSMKKLKS